MHAMTAAHRTYPLGSIVRVTNVKTGHSVLVRITDRGPFISGRVRRSVSGCSAQGRRMAAGRGPGESGTDGVCRASGLRPGNGPCRSADFPTNPPPANWPTISRAVITLPRFCVSPARPETGGSAFASSKTITSRAQKLAAETKTPEGAVFSSCASISDCALPADAEITNSQCSSISRQARKLHDRSQLPLLPHHPR